ncbi:hypothetical protein QUF72_11095 [Desulfobacterales bacterium HSG2]|nr:hypothetical protein [Desulfobacterales bacterium HSG2]
MTRNPQRTEDGDQNALHLPFRAKPAPPAIPGKTSPPVIPGKTSPPVIPGKTEKMGHFFSFDPESTEDRDQRTETRMPSTCHSGPTCHSGQN